MLVDFSHLLSLGALLIAGTSLVYTILSRRDKQAEARLKEIQTLYAEQISLLEMRLTDAEHRHQTDVARAEALEVLAARREENVQTLTLQLRDMQRQGWPGRRPPPAP